MSCASPELFRERLEDLGRRLRAALGRARAEQSAESLAAVADRTSADIIYRLDHVAERVILDWFAAEWPAGEPVEVMMEGLEERGPATFPVGTPVGSTRWKVLLDPIDGTRPLMRDKRPAWVLAGLAPQRGPDTSLADLTVSVMTELPVRKQGWADQVSAVRGGGPGGLRARRADLRTGAEEPLELRPSQTAEWSHGFSSFTKHLVQGKACIAALEEEFFRGLSSAAELAQPLIFDDQYLSTGGQMYEILSGRDLFNADLRPEVFRHLGLAGSYHCHPYDCVGGLILEEAGVLLEKPPGGRLDAPLDTVTPVSWVAWANPALAALGRPVLRRVLAPYLSPPPPGPRPATVPE